MAEPKTIPELKARIEADAKRLVEMVEEDMTKRYARASAPHEERPKWSWSYQLQTRAFGYRVLSASADCEMHTHDYSR